MLTNYQHPHEFLSVNDKWRLSCSLQFANIKSTIIEAQKLVLLVPTIFYWEVDWPILIRTTRSLVTNNKTLIIQIICLKFLFQFLYSKQGDRHLSSLLFLKLREETNSRSRPSRKFGEVRASTFHICCLPLVTFLSAVKYECGISTKFLHAK